MDTLTYEIYNELNWFIGRYVKLTTIFSTENDYEYYHEGKANIEWREVKGCGEMVDILLTKEEGSKGATFETSQLRNYTVENHEEDSYLVKTLTIYLKDGSLFILASEYANEDDSRETDITLPDEYVRFLFNLS